MSESLLSKNVSVNPASSIPISSTVNTFLAPWQNTSGLASSFDIVAPSTNSAIDICWCASMGGHNQAYMTVITIEPFTAQVNVTRSFSTNATMVLNFGLRYTRNNDISCAIASALFPINAVKSYTWSINGGTYYIMGQYGGSPVYSFRISYINASVVNNQRIGNIVPSNTVVATETVYYFEGTSAQTQMFS